MSDKVVKALEDIEMLCDYAYERGFHELGYDPVKLVRDNIEQLQGKRSEDHDPQLLLHALEALRQCWNHNVNFEATLGACKEEIELCIQRSASKTG